MRIQPLHDRILARRISKKKMTSEGLYIPDSAQETSLEALVVAAGTGKEFADGNVHPLAVKVGDHVLIGPNSGAEVTLDGEQHLILREDDVLGIIVEGRAV
jgi:chaperonin GroES